MAVRSALGARGNLQLETGLMLGFGLALVAPGALQPVLYPVDPCDPGVFLSVIAVLAVAALAATYLSGAARNEDRSGDRADDRIGGHRVYGNVAFQEMAGLVHLLPARSVDRELIVFFGDVHDRSWARGGSRRSTAWIGS